MTATEVIKRLGLAPLPFEGGYFRQTFRSQFQISGQPRCLGTAIYYLITQGSFSRLHRLLAQEELFHFYAGDPVEMIQISETGELSEVLLGGTFSGVEVFQALVPPRVWQGTKLCKGGEWALLGATVTPGFEYEDFEMKSKEELSALYPQHRLLFDEYLK